MTALKKKKKLSAVGGDSRQFYITEFLEEMGVETLRYGISGGDALNNCNSLEEVLEGAEYLLLPIPVTRDGYRLNSSEDIMLSELIKLIPRDCIVFGGKMPPQIKDQLESLGISCVDYFDNKAYIWKNADITAEGAVFQIMKELDISLSDSKILICGYGRIGKCLAKKLASLGSEVTVAARKEEDIMLASVYGGIGVDKLDYCREGIFDVSRRYDVILNTVPAWIFDANNKELLTDSIYIELASSPFGGEVEFMRKNCKKYIMSSGLPGKYAPRSAAKAVFLSIIEYFEKEAERP